MKGLLVAAAALAAYMLLATLLLRASRTEQRAGLLLRLFLLSLPAVGLACVVLPSNLGFLPSEMIRTESSPDLIIGLTLYGTGFFGGILQLYNLAERGLSLRILVDILESDSGCLDTDEILQVYGGGRGLVWMFEKRIDGLVAHDLLVREGALLRNSSRGRRVAHVFQWLRDFLHLRYGIE